MDIANFLADIGEGLASWLPTFAGTLVDTFIALFFTAGEGGAYTLNALGGVTVAFFVIGLGYKAIPAVLGWLRARWSARKSRKRR